MVGGGGGGGGGRAVILDLKASLESFFICLFIGYQIQTLHDTLEVTLLYQIPSIISPVHRPSSFCPLFDVWNAFSTCNNVA